MSSISTKQHVPIFVGSTFLDMKLYRDAAFQSLTQLEHIVRGMEYFGSQSDEPLNVCLKTVRSCQLYIGIFGMRYGSIPEGYDESMTHLEYLEAQDNELPSLIYIIDENNQPVLPRHIEFGDGARKLKALKSLLEKKHTCSYFTSPADLSAKLIDDVAKALKEVGVEIEDSTPESSPISDKMLLEKFKSLPALFNRKEIYFEEVELHKFRNVNADICNCLGLKPGATVASSFSIDGKRQYPVEVFASGDKAIEVISMDNDVIAKISGVTVYGTTKEMKYFDDDGPVSEISEYLGIHLNDITIK